VWLKHAVGPSRRAAAAGGNDGHDPAAAAMHRAHRDKYQGRAFCDAAPTLLGGAAPLARAAIHPLPALVETAEARAGMTCSRIRTGNLFTTRRRNRRDG